MTDLTYKVVIAIEMLAGERRRADALKRAQVKHTEAQAASRKAIEAICDCLRPHLVEALEGHRSYIGYDIDMSDLRITIDIHRRLCSLHVTLRDRLGNEPDEEIDDEDMNRMNEWFRERSKPYLERVTPRFTFKSFSLPYTYFPK